jgi:hypothetical protein
MLLHALHLGGCTSSLVCLAGAWLACIAHYCALLLCTAVALW